MFHAAIVKFSYCYLSISYVEVEYMGASMAYIKSLFKLLWNSNFISPPTLNRILSLYEVFLAWFVKFLSL